MSILLCSTEEPLVNLLSHYEGDKFILLIHDEESALRHQLSHILAGQEDSDRLRVVDIHSPRLRRINYDLAEYIIVDLPRQYLLDSAGRRFLESLSQLAGDGLTLALTGANTELAGAFLSDGQTAGLNLVPSTMIITSIGSEPNLRNILLLASKRLLRLLALEGSVAAEYTRATDSVRVMGSGSAFLASFPEAKGRSPQAARLHILSDGMQSGWQT